MARISLPTSTPSRPETGVLYMSGYSEDALGPRGMVGADINYVQKPFTVSLLLEKVRFALDAEQNREPESGH